MQACFLRYVRIILYNSLGNSHFQTNVIDFVENLFDYYLYITFSVLCTLISCTHYTQIFAKLSTWDCACGLIWSSLIAYELMHKCLFFFLFFFGWKFEENVFWSLNFFFFLTSWSFLIFVFKSHNVFKTFLDHVHLHWPLKTAFK